MSRVVLGRVKRGDDKQFRDIVVTVAGDPQDLTAAGWEVAAQMRMSTSSQTAVDFGIDPDALTDSIIRLSFTAEQTATMDARSWVADVEVTGPEARQSSDTFTVVVESDITHA